jgi:hypothetical protein
MSSLETMIASMTLAELAKLANSTVEQIVTTAMSSSRSRSNDRPPVHSSAPVRMLAGHRAEATVPRGGVRVDRLLNVVAGAKGPIDINAIRAKIGGSPDQLRAALKKLATAGQVKITGKRRGTRYAAV